MRESAKLLIASLFFIFVFLLQTQNVYAWLSGFTYRRAINITNSGSTALTDYQVLITLDTQSLISQGKMRSDCGDIRITYYDSTDGTEIEIPQWVWTNQTNYTGLSYSWWVFGCNTPNTRITVKVPYVPASSNATIYIYYGNPQATSVSSLTNVFSTSGKLIATLPYGVEGLSCAPYQDSIYCFGGYDGSNRLNQIVRYNVTDNTTTTLSATLPSGRYLLSCAPYGDSIYCFGGYDNSGRLNQIVRYNVTSNTVTVMSATLPSARNWLSCAPYQDSIYCFGGVDGTGYLNQIVRYNITSNTVTTMSATLPSARIGLSCVPYGDSIYCFGGYDGSNRLNQIVRYNVTSNTVTVMSATLPYGIHKLSCAPAGDNIYCFGGNNSSIIDDIILYNITNNSARRVGGLPTYREGLSCVPHGDSIYCFGGYGYFSGDLARLKDILRYGRGYASPEPAVSVGAEESINPPPTITIFSPQNTTYFYSNNFIFNFSVSDDRSSSFVVKAYLDNNLIYENTNYQNNSIVVLTRNLTDGTHTFTVWANDTDTTYPPQTIQQSVIFTIKDFEIQQIIYNTNVYETSQQTFSEIIRYNPDLVQNISSILVWNSTSYSTSQTQNSTHFALISNIYIPLVQTNNTQINFYFSNQITYTNGTTATINSQTNQQNILFAYIPSGLSVPKNVIEMDYIPVSFSPTYYSTNADLQAYAYFRNQAVQLTSRSYGYFTGSIDALNVTNYNETYPIYADLVINFNNQTITRTSNQTNITVYKVTLTDCSIFPNQTFSLIVKDEETTNILTTLNYTFLRFDVTPLNNRITRTYTFENKQTICIYPAWATYNAKIYAIVRKDNYALTTHAPYTISVLSNQTQTLTLYMLPNTYATPITFTLPDQNYILYIERGYGANFVYIRSDTADFNKKVIIYMRPYDVYYKVKIFTPEQTLCFQSEQFKVASNTYEILSCQTGLVNYTITPMYQKIINGNCSTYDLLNYTRVLCSFVTLDNLDHDVELKIYKLVEPFGEIVYYQNSTKASTGSFDVLLEKGYDYKVVMSAHSIFDYITFNIYSKVLQKSAEVFTLALMLFVVSAVVGFINPFAGLIMNVLILLSLSATGVLTLQTGVIGALTLLIIVAIIFTREWR